MVIVNLKNTNFVEENYKFRTYNALFVILYTDFIEKFYNFAFFGGGSINGRHWEYPPVSAASQKDELQDVDTTCKECTKDKVRIPATLYRI